MTGHLLALFLSVFIPASFAPQPRPTPWIDKVLHDAGIPERLWDEFAAVAACESSFDATAQNGSATGLFQIHGSPWVEWARRNEHVKVTDLHDPVQNAALAHAIGQHYDIPRGRGRWNQWQAKPQWAACRYRAEQLMYISINGDKE